MEKMNHQQFILLFLISISRWCSIGTRTISVDGCAKAEFIYDDYPPKGIFFFLLFGLLFAIMLRLKIELKRSRLISDVSLSQVQDYESFVTKNMILNAYQFKIIQLICCLMPHHYCKKQTKYKKNELPLSQCLIRENLRLFFFQVSMSTLNYLNRIIKYHI